MTSPTGRSEAARLNSSSLEIRRRCRGLPGRLRSLAASFLLRRLLLLLPLPPKIAAGWMTKREEDSFLGCERSGPMKLEYLRESKGFARTSAEKKYSRAESLLPLGSV